VTLGDDVYDVSFIPLDDSLPPDEPTDEEDAPGIRWRVELHPAMLRGAWPFKSLPLAWAWVYVYRFWDSPQGGAAEVRWIQVPKRLRRKGYGTLLLAEIK
jgi:hypothetical protein